MGKPKKCEIQACSSVTLSAINAAYIDMGANSDLQGEEPVINHLSCGRADFGVGALTISEVKEMSRLHNKSA